MTKYRQKDNEAVIKVTNDIEVCFIISSDTLNYLNLSKRFVFLTNDMLL